MGFSLVAASGSYFLVGVCRLLIAMAYLVLGQRFWGTQAQ